MDFTKMTIEELETRKAAIATECEAEGADLDKLTEEVRGINAELEARKAAEAKKAEIRTAVAQGAGIVIEKPVKEERAEMTETEKRAKDFAEQNKTEMRAVLSTGTIAKPTKADGINGLADVATDIVDDVKAIPLTGNGAYTVAYKATDASAAAVTDGQTIGGTGATFNTVTINPAEWGVLDTVSKQVKKMTSVNYLAAVEESALNALRAMASTKIVTAILASTLAQNIYSATLDQSYIRKLVLGFRSIKGKGGVVLYLNQTDLATLGAVRGTNEKKPVYEIAFDEGTTSAGTIKDGGTAVRFRVLDSLTTGVQLFGQPQTVEMPMWDNYEISTDEGGEYFAKNLIAVKGLQTAGADLCAKHGMQIVHQAAES